MKNILLSLIIFAALYGYSQPTLCVGTGTSSAGQWVSCIEANNIIAGQWGFGIKALDQDAMADCPKNLPNVCELHQWSIRMLYSPPACERISLFVGGGKFRSEHFVNLDGHYRSDRTVKGNCAEIGFAYKLIDRRRFCAGLSGSLDSYSGVNTMVIAGFKIRSHE